MQATCVSALPQYPRLASVAIAVLAAMLAAASSVCAQSIPYYPPGTYTPFSTLEAVHADGSSSFSFPSNGSPITVVGIVLNNPADMLDGTPNYQPWDISGSNAFHLGGQWQIFIQAYSDPIVGGSPSDFGGCEVWMGQNYGNLPWIASSSDSYTNSQWTAKLATLNNPALISTSSTVALHPGVVVAITSYGLEYEGMMNINQQHYINNPLTITALETGVPLPAPTATSLSQMMNSDGKFSFDPTRQTGAEHLQGTRVHLDGVRVLSGTWAPGNDVVITDGSLRQMLLQIGVNSNLTLAPTGAFNVTGILDQESTDGSNQNGYALWLTDSGNVSVQPNSGGTFNWSGSGGSWNAAGKWAPTGKPQNPGDAAILGGSLSVAATVTLDGPEKVGCLILANANSSTTGYTLSSGTLTFDNLGAAALLTVISGSHTISAPVALADDLDVSVADGSRLTLSGGIRENSSGLSLHKQGGGRLVLSGTNSYRGGTTVSDGTLIVESPAALADGMSLIVGDATAFSAPVAAESTSSAESRIYPVPEPGTLALILIATSGALWICRKRRKDHA